MKPKSTNPTTITPRPLADMNVAMRDLDLDAHIVQELIEEGKLVAFNIAMNETSRRELRILTSGIELYKEASGKKPQTLEWPEIFRLILPHEKPYVNGADIKRSLNCDGQHVLNLMNAGMLGTLNKPARRGPGNSAIVSRSGFESFLKRRLQ